MVLSKRLARLASHYHGTPCIWDIGCDHGQLGMSFLDRNELQSIHLVDPSHAVIKKLQNNIKDADIPRANFIKLHRQKGQDIQLQNNLDQCIFIAGMGGNQIQEILQNLIPQMSKRDRLVVSPHRKILDLRSFLYQSELRLHSEEALLEGKHYYQILCLAKDPTLPLITEFGVDIWRGEVGEEYRKQQIRQFSLHRDPHSRAYVTYLEALQTSTM